MSSAEIVLSGMNTKTISKLLESNKAKLEQRRRQSNKLFTLHATSVNDEDSVDYLSLFELVVQEITTLESNVEMFQAALTKRARTRMAGNGPRVTKISK